MIDCTKQSDESTQDYQYFSDYLAAGPARSFDLFADLSPYDKKYVRALSIKHHWAERARAFDLDHAPALTTAVPAVSDNNSRFDRALNDAALVLEIELRKWVDLVKLSLDPGLQMNELLKLLDAAIKLDALRRGSPTSIDEHRISGDDRKQLIDLLKHPTEVSLVEEILQSIETKEGES